MARMSLKTCKICERKHYCKEYCEPHYRKWKKYGDPRFVKRQPAGSGSLIPSGYIVINRSKGRQYAHREIMEEILGRPLMKNERVHHINGVRHDNSPENLELWSVSQPAGQRVEDKIAWAKQILETYKELKN